MLSKDARYYMYLEARISKSEQNFLSTVKTEMAVYKLTHNHASVQINLMAQL